MNIKAFSKMIITNNNKKKLTMKNSLIKDAKTYKYVEYNRISCKDFYNEIFSFIKDNNNIPFRLTNEAKPDNKKKQRDKRIEFKAMIKDKYRIGNDRLQYNYYYPPEKKFIWLNIPYKMN